MHDGRSLGSPTRCPLSVPPDRLPLHQGGGELQSPSHSRPPLPWIQLGQGEIATSEQLQVMYKYVI